MYMRAFVKRAIFRQILLWPPALQLEQRIRELCLRLIATDESGEFEALAQDLRDALHSHIEELRRNADRLALVNQLLLSPEATPQINK